MGKSILKGCLIATALFYSFNVSAMEKKIDALAMSKELLKLNPGLAEDLAKKDLDAWNKAKDLGLNIVMPSYNLSYVLKQDRANLAEKMTKILDKIDVDKAINLDVKTIGDIKAEILKAEQLLAASDTVLSACFTIYNDIDVLYDYRYSGNEARRKQIEKYLDGNFLENYDLIAILKATSFMKSDALWAKLENLYSKLAKTYKEEEKQKESRLKAERYTNLRKANESEREEYKKVLEKKQVKKEKPKEIVDEITWMQERIKAANEILEEDYEEGEFEPQEYSEQQVNAFLNELKEQFTDEGDLQAVDEDEINDAVIELIEDFNDKLDEAEEKRKEDLVEAQKTEKLELKKEKKNSKEIIEKIEEAEATSKEQHGFLNKLIRAIEKDIRDKNVNDLQIQVNLFKDNFEKFLNDDTARKYIYILDKLFQALNKQWLSGKVKGFVVIRDFAPYALKQLDLENVSRYLKKENLEKLKDALEKLKLVTQRLE